MFRNCSLLVVLVLLIACGEVRVPDEGEAAPLARSARASVDRVVHDDEAERVPDRRAAHETRIDPATVVRYPVLDHLLRSTDTLASARKRLGAANVMPDSLYVGEGEFVPGWTLYRGHPTRELSVYLDEAGEHPVSVVAGSDVSEWRRADGVRIGMSSGELALLNGRAFDFLGFDWDMGGYIADWNGGTLGPSGESTGPVRLCQLERSETDAPVDLPAGDQEFSSDDPRMRGAPVAVCRLAVNLRP